MIDVPEAEYVVFEHGPFDYDQENNSVEKKMEKAMANFDFGNTGYCFDTSAGRVFPKSKFAMAFSIFFSTLLFS
jgi:hypothetical protein